MEEKHKVGLKANSETLGMQRAGNWGVGVGVGLTFAKTGALTGKSGIWSLKIWDLAFVSRKSEA